MESASPASPSFGRNDVSERGDRMNEKAFIYLSGQGLRRIRKAAGMSQIDLAAEVGISRHAVQYWEKKPVLSRYGSPARMVEVLKVRVLPQKSLSLRARGGMGSYSFPDRQQERIDRASAAQIARETERERKRLAKRRVICGAKTRKGQPCRNKSEPGRLRCKFHGGLSTGPKTIEGRKRIADAQRLRWMRFHKRKEQFETSAAIGGKSSD